MMSGLTQSGSGGFEQAGRGRSDQHWTAAELEWARKRIKKRNRLWVDVATSVVINVFLVVVWVVNGDGYFWPGWVMGGWVVLLLLDAWHLYDHKPIAQDEFDHELRREH